MNVSRQFAITPCRRRRRARVMAIPMLVLATVCMVWSGRAADADDELFQVLAVKVDETAETAAAAREKALVVGERRAWETLVQRFVDPTQVRLPQFSQQDIGDAVKDFWITEEKASPVRYIATLNYNFKPERVGRLLTSRGVRFTTTRSDPFVVVPMYVQNDERLLWDDPNPWRQAWQSIHVVCLVPLKVPDGDLGDLSTVSIDQALAGDRARLAELAQRHGAADTLVAIARVDADRRQLKVSATRYNATTAEPVGERAFPIESQDITPELLKQAAVAVANDLDAYYRRGFSSTAGTGMSSSSVTRVVVPVFSLEDWVQTRSKLQSLAQVDRVKLISITREQAQLSITYPGNTDQLAAALGQKGLFLRKVDSGWIVATEPQALNAVPGTTAQ